MGTRVLLASASALALAVCGRASAQSTPERRGAQPVQPAGPPASPTPSTATPAIGEIIVTAQKRSENINSVPMSITAASRQQLEQKGIAAVSDLVRIEPSLQFSQTSYGTPVYTIRGVGYYEQSLAATPTVSIYQDEVNFPFPVMSRGVLLDPDRVEVLKGPQGILFGQNATGGAVNFIAAKPTDTFTAGVDETFGRFDANLASGFVSGPLTPTLNARAAFSTENGGAWQRSETREDSLGDKDTQIGRLLLDWKPDNKFKASLNLNGWLDRSDTQAEQLEGVRFISPQYVSPSALTPASANYLPNPAYAATYPPAIKALTAQPTDLSNDRQADWTPGTHPHNNEQFYQAALRLEYTFNDNIGLTSLTSYERFTEHNSQDTGGVGAAYTTDLINGDVASASQEIRLHGTFYDRRVNWLVGFNYENDKSRENDLFSPFLASPAYLTGGSAFSLAPLSSFVFGARNRVNTDTYSAFVNGDYRVLDTVTLHGGVRFTQSNQNIAGCSYGDTSYSTYVNLIAQELAGAFGGAAPVPIGAGQCATLGPAPSFQPETVLNRLDQNNAPWRVGVDWTPLPHQLFYFNVSKGYKAGASPALGATSYIQFTPVTQEALMTYEVGFKSSLLDRRMQLNGAYFHYDYTDKQELGDISDPLGIFGSLQSLVNIPKSEEDGFELSGVWRPLGGLTLNAATTFLDSRVTSDFFNYGSYILGPTDTVDFKGEPFPYTPKWSVQYGVRYDWDLPHDLAAFVSADASYQSRSNGAFATDHSAAEGGPPLTIRAYNLLNLTAGLASTDQHWRVELWAKNVTNTYYWTSVFYAADTTVRLAGLPTTFGVGLHYRY